MIFWTTPVRTDLNSRIRNLRRGVISVDYSLEHIAHFLYSSIAMGELFVMACLNKKSPPIYVTT